MLWTLGAVAMDTQMMLCAKGGPRAADASLPKTSRVRYAKQRVLERSKCWERLADLSWRGLHRVEETRHPEDGVGEH